MNHRNPHFSGIRLAAPGSGIFVRLLTIASAATLLAIGLMFSLLALALLLVGGLLGFAFLQWKTRHLRRQWNEGLRASAAQPGKWSTDDAAGRVIEGEVIDNAEQHSPASALRLPACCDSPRR